MGHIRLVPDLPSVSFIRSSFGSVKVHHGFRKFEELFAVSCRLGKSTLTKIWKRGESMAFSFGECLGLLRFISLSDHEAKPFGARVFDRRESASAPRVSAIETSRFVKSS